MSKVRTGTVVAIVGVAAGLAGASGAVAQAPAPASIDVRVVGLQRGTVPAGYSIRLTARIAPYVAGERVTIELRKGRRRLGSFTGVVRRAGNAGTVTVKSPVLTHPGPYRVVVTKAASAAQQGATGRSAPFWLRYPDLDPGDRGPAVRLFNRLLAQRGYYTFQGPNYGSHTERAVLAFRKVNGLSRNGNATPRIFRVLAAGGGSFPLKHPSAGRHVEVDVSRQVLVLADRGRPRYTFHISSGKSSTPSDYGRYKFYSKDPGFNGVGMYYSIYYNGGEATHGYHSVPTYAASHGCLRNPIPDSRFIYDWVDIGMTIWVDR